MSDPITILAIEGRAESGVSLPFRCLDADNTPYYVKLKNVGYDHLIKEWICGRLAQCMGLPCADIHQVFIPEVLVKGIRSYEAELGHGIAFASKLVPNTVPLAKELVRRYPGEYLSKILLFDWWTRNSDRSLSDTGGNPNLLWEASSHRVVMIDHDNAFDTDFSPSDFWNLHALNDQREIWVPSRREEMSTWLHGGFDNLDLLWDEIPEEWLFDTFGDPRVTLDKSGLASVLSSPFDDPVNFWNTPLEG